MTSTEPTSPSAAIAANKGGTEYVVLYRGTDTSGWEFSSNERAASASAAVALSADNGAEGTYVAIPARSFKPVRVSVETVSRVRLEGA